MTSQNTITKIMAQPSTINPEMQDALSSLNETNYVLFFYQTPELIDEEDSGKIKNNIVAIGRNVLISLFLGITINVQFKNIKRIKFLEMNRLTRWSIRFPLFIAPYLLLFHRSMTKNYEEMFSMHVKYFKRIRGFQRTGDMRYLDPKGRLMQKMM